MTGAEALAPVRREVDEQDPLLCPRCGGTMRVIAVIERPAVIRQILGQVAPDLNAQPSITSEVFRPQAPLGPM